MLMGQALRSDPSAGSTCTWSRDRRPEPAGRGSCRRTDCRPPVSAVTPQALRSRTGRHRRPQEDCTSHASPGRRSCRRWRTGGATGCHAQPPLPPLQCPRLRRQAARPLCGGARRQESSASSSDQGPRRNRSQCSSRTTSRRSPGSACRTCGSTTFRTSSRSTSGLLTWAYRAAARRESARSSTTSASEALVGPANPGGAATRTGWRCCRPSSANA